ncbi:MAG: ABC transporter ATP-binding protein [Bacteroidaceae bacterium]|nr:ABC transporter ATP-binding protein [Bacteroidaceae bacterium]
MIELTDIRRSFSGLEVLKGISLSIEKGEIVSITGPSGAGKTTLLQIMGTLDSPTSGHVLFDGTDTTLMDARRLAAFRCSHIGFVFQFHQLLPEFTALENIMIPGLIRGTGMQKVQDRAEMLLGKLGLSDRKDHKPAELSGGEKQRIAVARALMNEPDVILADEPSGSLDSRNRDELHKLFLDFRNEFGQTFVIVTHDENLANLADRRIHILDGHISG